MRSGRGVARAHEEKRKAFHNILRYSERRSLRYSPSLSSFFFFLNNNKKIPAGSQSYIYAKQARKPSRPPGAGNEPKQGHCVQATGWLRGIVRAWPCLGRGGHRGQGECVPMTPWGVTTIKASCEARMPGACGRVAGPRGAVEGCRGLKRRGEAARSRSVSQLGGGGGGHLLYPSLSSPPPESPGPLSHFANDTPDLPTSLHPKAPP